MNDRTTIVFALVGAVLLEIMLLYRSGLLTWAASGPHSSDEVRGMMTDWRVMASVVLVSVILWLVYRLIRVSADRSADADPKHPV
jgi:heme/copper-type cytochrome/quinol oxidase subunit 2